MSYLVGSIFLLISIWQFSVTWKTLTQIKKTGNKSTSPFIMVSLWSSLAFAIIFFAIAIRFVFGEF